MFLLVNAKLYSCVAIRMFRYKKPRDPDNRFHRKWRRTCASPVGVSVVDVDRHLLLCLEGDQVEWEGYNDDL